MARDPHGTPPPSALTDTGRQRAIDDVVAEAVDKIADLTTPAPGGHRMRPGESSERMYEVAERVVERNRPNEWVACEEKGPAAKLARTVDAMGTRLELRMGRIENEQMDDRKDVVRIQQALDKFIGERDFKRWVLPLVIGIAGSSLSAALVMFVANRLLKGHP